MSIFLKILMIFHENLSKKWSKMGTFWPPKKGQKSGFPYTSPGNRKITKIVTYIPLEFERKNTTVGQNLSKKYPPGDKIRKNPKKSEKITYFSKITKNVCFCQTGPTKMHIFWKKCQFFRKNLCIFWKSVKFTSDKSWTHLNIEKKAENWQKFTNLQKLHKFSKKWSKISKFSRKKAHFSGVLTLARNIYI